MRQFWIMLGALACAVAGGVSFPANASGAAEQQAQIETVVVTAEKRAENSQDVAVSLSALTAADIQNQKLEQLSDYLSEMPGVNVTNLGSPGQSAITIRGIPPLTSGSKVATYIDDSPLGSSGIWAASSSFQLDLLPFDLDRVELLRGPQGTLYGASAMGGLLKYVLATPDPDQFFVKAGFDIATVQGSGGVASTVDAKINIPLDESLAVSVSAYDKYAPGYIDNAYTGARNVNSDKQYGGRIALFWQPLANLTVKLSALWQRTNSRDDATMSFANPVQTTLSNGVLLLSAGTGYGKLTESKAFLAPFKSNVDFYSATIDWNPGPIEVVSATSWSRLNITHVADDSIAYGSYFPLFGLPPGLVRSTLDLNVDKFTQEVRVLSPQDNPLSWIAGAFYTSETAFNGQLVSAYDTSYNPVSALAPYAGYAGIPTTYKEYAFFGDLTWKISDALDITGGARYSQNSQKFGTVASGALLGLPQSPPTVLPNVKSKQDDVTWMANARYHFTSDVMAYVRVATGYAPGGANTPYPGAPLSVGSETLTSYELGLKSEFLDHTALVNVSAFHLDWNNIQLPAVVNNVGFTENGGRASTNGFELESTISPVANLTLGFNAAYTAAQLTSLASNVSIPFILHTQLLDVPKWTISGTVDYAWPVFTDWMANIGADARWIGARDGAERAAGQVEYVLPSYGVLDLNARLTRGSFTLEAYVKNLTNSGAFQSGYPATDLFGVTEQIDYTIMQPRTIGLSVTKAF